MKITQFIYRIDSFEGSYYTLCDKREKGMEAGSDTLDPSMIPWAYCGAVMFDDPGIQFTEAELQQRH